MDKRSFFPLRFISYFHVLSQMTSTKFHTSYQLGLVIQGKLWEEPKKILLETIKRYLNVLDLTINIKLHSSMMKKRSGHPTPNDMMSFIDDEDHKLRNKKETMVLLATWQQWKLIQTTFADTQVSELNTSSRHANLVTTFQICPKKNAIIDEIVKSTNR